jgi:hypothetical protein
MLGPALLFSAAVLQCQNTHHHVREGQAHEWLAIQQQVQYLRVLLLLFVLVAVMLLSPLLLLVMLLPLSLLALGVAGQLYLHWRYRQYIGL